MGTAPLDPRSDTDASRTGERLDSWKEIAAYLSRSVRTLHRSGDGTRLFLLRHTKEQEIGELASVSVEGGVLKMHGPIGPFQHRYLMSMDASPRDEIVFARYREGPHELWLARLH